MALFDWDNSFSVGVLEIDRQHQQLVNILNQLHHGMIQRQQRAETGALLQQLIAYTHDHFLHEERLFARSHYPKAAQHTQLHAELTGQVRDYANRYERGEIALDIHLLDFLRKWLMNHILEEDKAYGPWLNQAGIH